MEVYKHARHLTGLTVCREISPVLAGVLPVSLPQLSLHSIAGQARPGPLRVPLLGVRQVQRAGDGEAGEGEEGEGG